MGRCPHRPVNPLDLGRPCLARAARPLSGQQPPKLGPQVSMGHRPGVGGSGGSGGLCSAAGVTLDLRLHQMMWPPASSEGPLLPRPGAPSLLPEPPHQQDTTAPVPGSRRAEARPARPGRDPRGAERLGECGAGGRAAGAGRPGRGPRAPLDLSPCREASMVACRVPAPPLPPGPRSGASPSSRQAPQVCTCTGLGGGGVSTLPRPPELGTGGEGGSGLGRGSLRSGPQSPLLAPRRIWPGGSASTPRLAAAPHPGPLAALQG